MIQVEFRSFYFNINNQGTYIYRYVVIKLEKREDKSSTNPLCHFFV